MAEGGENSPPPFEVNEDRYFRNQLLANLHDLQQSESFTDFTVKVGKTSIPCHKVVLSAACPYFHTMLKSGLEETRKQEVDLHYLDEVVAQQLIEYFYNGSIKLEYGKIKQLVEACELFQIGELKTQCEDYIIKYLIPDNCIDWCKFGGMYKLDKLVTRAKKVMCDSFLHVIEGTHFLELEFAELIDYIKNDDVNVQNEDGVLLACIKWIDYDKEQKLKSMTDLLSHVRLPFCTPSFLKYALKTYPDIMSTDDVMKKIHSKTSSITETDDISVHSRKHFMVRQPKLTIIGGAYQSNESCKNGWILQVPAGAWKLLTSIPDEAKLQYPSICVIHYGLLLTGGRSSTDNSSKVHMYHSLSDSWVQLKNMPQPKYAHASHLVDKYVYLFGGCIGPAHQQILDTVHKFDLVNNTWQAVQNMIHPLFFPITAQMDIFVFAVMHSNPPNSELYDKHGLTLQEFNIVTEKWTLKQPMPSEITTTRGASAVVADDKMYVVGGEGNICTQYNPKTDTWVLLKAPNLTHVYGKSLLHQDRILLMGGGTTGSLLTLSDAIEEYDINANTWQNSTYSLPKKLKHFFPTLM